MIRGDPGRRPWARWWVLAAAVVTAGAWTAFWRLQLPTVWIDEATYRDASWAYVHGDLGKNPEHPPLAKLVLGAWQLVTGNGIVQLRVLMGIVCLGTAALLWWWSTHLVGRTWALLPAAGWLLLLHRSETGGRLDRLAQLDSLMVLFLVATFAVAWRWSETLLTPLALVAGCLAAAAVTSKVSAVFFLPALVVLVPRTGPVRTVVRGAVAFVAGFVAVAAAVLVPFGGLDALREMWDFQSRHNSQGHAVLLGDRVYTDAPWWATGRLALEGLGTLQCAALVVGVAAAAVLVRPRRVVWLLLGALALPLVFFSLVSNVALPHYYLDWVWIPTLLTALSVPALVRRRGRPALVVAAVLALGLAVGVGQGAALTLAGPPDLLRAQRALADADVADGIILVQGVSPAVDIASCFAHPVAEPGYPGITAAVVGSDPRSPVDPALRNWVDDPPRGVAMVRFGGIVVLIPDRAVVLEDGQLRLATRR